MKIGRSTNDATAATTIPATTTATDDNNANNDNDDNTDILAIFYPPLKQTWGCVWLFLQAQEGNIYFTEFVKRVDYGNYDRFPFAATTTIPATTTATNVYIYIYIYIINGINVHK